MSEPPFAVVIAHALAVFCPTSVSMPAPPEIVPVMWPVPESVKRIGRRASGQVLDAREQVRARSVRERARVQARDRPGVGAVAPTSVSVPALPDIVPVIVPPAKTKVSAPAPPCVFSMPVKVAVLTPSDSVPAFVPVIVQVLTPLFAVSVSVPAPPAIVPLDRPRARRS